MQTKYFSPSVNIIRDQEVNLEYIVTPNTQQVYNSIISNYLKGSRSFNLIGNYGTGKSSFVVALEQTLNKKKEHFKKGQLFSNIESFEFINIVGDYESLTQHFYDHFGVKNNKDFFKVFEDYYANLRAEKKALLIVIDEFGKFLEYASHNNPEGELYFVQMLAEFVNDPSKEILFLSVLHQNFNAYSHNLDPSRKMNGIKSKVVLLN
ncbi:MAG: hypothetical protein U5Q03_01565 [Bacteroidota bacterium]|nr:hypothetical protein [Bacteroidota bacterium]